MRRREFIGLVVWATSVQAQQPTVRRVGAVFTLAEDDTASSAWTKAFSEQLRDLGWAEGSNLEIRYRWTGGHAALARDFSRELLAWKPDVLVGSSNLIVRALMAETRTIPIVFTHTGDPVASGLVASLARPEGNVTGFANMSVALNGKWASLLKEVAPQTQRITAIFNPRTVPAVPYFKELASQLGVAVTVTHVYDEAGIEDAIRTTAKEGNSALMVVPDGSTRVHMDVIIRLTREYGVPAVYGFAAYPQSGGLMSYGVNSQEILRQAATYVDRLLRGAKPADLPVQDPTKFELVINLATAKALGLEVPPHLLIAADEVIE